ncbi:hypothetical protein L484_027303 [Morus notabilis]|uniref:Uncharacterized protein n=1 Tax=Morus notabilis TaxID=981085 RepID=W9QUQ1_9ROSA|nr:hypothetical protein L484_027303 [Morus notabilis]
MQMKVLGFLQNDGDVVFLIICENHVVRGYNLLQHTQDDIGKFEHDVGDIIDHQLDAF